MNKKRSNRDWDNKVDYSSYKGEEEEEKENEYSDNEEEYINNNDNSENEYSDNESDEEYDSNDNEEEDGSQIDSDQEEINRLESEIKNQLSSVKLGTLVKLQSKTNEKGGKNSKSSKVTTSFYNDKKKLQEQREKMDKLTKRNEVKREDNDAPLELTAMRPVSRFRQVLQNKTVKVRDPRFMDLSGSFNEREYRKNYKFLDDVKRGEIEKLKTFKKQLEQNSYNSNNNEGENNNNSYKKGNESRELQKINKMIQSKQSQLESQMAKDKKRELHDRILDNEVESVKKGKTPYQLSKKALRDIELKEKFKQLKESHKLDKFMEKRTKKVSQKEKVFIPRKRRNLEGDD